jgi:hypothetical protein
MHAAAIALVLLFASSSMQQSALGASLNPSHPPPPNLSEFSSFQTSFAAELSPSAVNAAGQDGGVALFELTSSTRVSRNVPRPILSPPGASVGDLPQLLGCKCDVFSAAPLESHTACRHAGLCVPRLRSHSRVDCNGDANRQHLRRRFICERLFCSWRRPCVANSRSPPPPSALPASHVKRPLRRSPRRKSASPWRGPIFHRRRARRR